jgi:hypothetical protein
MFWFLRKFIVIVFRLKAQLMVKFDIWNHFIRNFLNSNYFL